MAAPTQLAFPQLGAGKSSQSEVMLGEDGVTRSRREGSPQLGALRPRQRGGTVSSSSHHQVGPQEGTVRQQADPTKSILLTRLASHGILVHVPHISPEHPRMDSTDRSFVSLKIETGEPLVSSHAGAMCPGESPTDFGNSSVSSV